MATWSTCIIQATSLYAQTSLRNVIGTTFLDQLLTEREELTGCELCMETCPEIFEIQGDVSVVKVGEIPEDAEECVKQAEEECPVEAIKIEYLS